MLYTYLTWQGESDDQTGWVLQCLAEYLVLDNTCIVMLACVVHRGRIASSAAGSRHQHRQALPAPMSHVYCRNWRSATATLLTVRSQQALESKQRRWFSRGMFLFLRCTCCIALLPWPADIC